MRKGHWVHSIALTLLIAGSVLGQLTFKIKEGEEYRVETVIRNLEVPWSMAFDPDGNLFVTERPGRLRRIQRGGSTAELIAEIEDVSSSGEGGLMGLALHPAFGVNRLLYVSYTFSSLAGGGNRVVRYRYANGELREPKVIVDDLPGSFVHNGCRIKFGPDEKLYITSGDAAKWDRAQKMDSYGGKVLRVNDDGTIPTDNPFRDSPIFVMGVRNPQGLAWDPIGGSLWETEHGPSGFEGRGSGGDEVNILVSGRNYGWPVISHKEKRKGLESPVLEYSPAVAPCGASFVAGKALSVLQGNLFVACLRGERIVRIVLDSRKRTNVSFEESLLQGTYGRIRDVVEGPDGFLYFCTSNKDGRGRPSKDDDRILRITPK